MGLFSRYKVPSRSSKKYLVCGILFCILFAAVIGMGIYHFTYAPTSDAIGLMFILLIPASICMLFAVGYLGAWRRRSEFTLYYSPVAAGIPEDSVLSKSARVDVTMSYFVFVEEENLGLYSDWHLMNGADALLDVMGISDEDEEELAGA